MRITEPAIIESWDGEDLEFSADFDLNSDFELAKKESVLSTYRIQHTKISSQPPISCSEDEYDFDSAFPGEDTSNLSNRLWNRQSELVLTQTQPDEFFTDIDVDGGRVFELDSSKSRINLNIKRTLTLKGNNCDPLSSKIPRPRSPLEYKDLSKKPSLISIRPQSAEKQLIPKNSMPSLRSSKQPPKSISTRSSTGRSSPSIQVTRPFLPGGKSGLSHHVSTKKNYPPSSKQLQNSRSKPTLASESLRKEVAGVRLLTKPRRLCNFGNGTELDTFEDLPIGFREEGKYRVTMSKNTRIATIKEKDVQPKTSKLFSRFLPRRDLTPSQVSSCEPSKKKSKSRPTLIQNLNSANLSKSAPPKSIFLTRLVHGHMKYNPSTYKWEGNESALDEFLPTSPTSRPALISNINNATKNVHVVGNMVFDPLRMCWLKNNSQDSDSDPFEGMDDLVQDNESKVSLGNFEFVVGEEFDVGPEFIRRQMEEEHIWRRTVDGWVSGERKGRDHLWDIREIVMKRS